MRIRRIHVESFGSMRDRTFDVAPGMTVFHGPNESGKTTLMEFIRTVTVPSSKRNQYPARRKSDSGTMVYEEDGAEHEVGLDHRSISGEPPSLPSGADDPDLYRSVFAMDQRGLDDDVVSGELQSRFLTVPGGERMPDARKAIEEELSEVLGKTSRSPSAVNRISGEMSENADAVSRARSEVDSYSALAAERDALAAELEGLRGASEASAEARRVMDLYASQSANFARLESLKSELEGLGGYRAVTPEAASEHRDLREREREAEAALRALEGQRGEIADGLRGADPREVSRLAQRIEALPAGLGAYRRDREVLNGPAPERRRETRTVRRTSPLVYAGLLMAVLGLVAGAAVSVYAFALAAAGAAVLCVGLLRPSVSDVEFASDVRFDERTAAAESARAFESEVVQLMEALGQRPAGPEADVPVLAGIRRAAASLSESEARVMKARLDLNQAQTAVLRFESVYGGPEGYADCVSRTSRAAEIQSEAKVIRGSIVSAGLDPDIPECPVTEAGGPGREEAEDVSRRIGETEQMMRSILDHGEVERLMDRREELDAMLSDALRRGAVALLALSIAEDACEDIYSTVRPGVVSTADRYLSLMTGGRYSIDTDPMSDVLAVRSDEGSKPIGQWSSGLRAQVMLSVKLAVAREMGAGRVPVVLDDVLLPFDSGRKAGACRALAELSSEMQVLLFTCDSETAGICGSIPGVSVVEMSPGSHR